MENLGYVEATTYSVIKACKEWLKEVPADYDKEMTAAIDSLMQDKGWFGRPKFKNKEKAKLALLEGYWSYGGRFKDFYDHPVYFKQRVKNLLYQCEAGGQKVYLKTEMANVLYRYLAIVNR